MIEPGLFFGLGFLAAGLLALLVVPLIHARAVRLTRRRLENAGPLSLAEIQADKDSLRAEFALSTRRLEMSIEQLREKAAGQLAEIGKKTTAFNTLKAELADRIAEGIAGDERARESADKLQATEQALAAATEKLRETERALTESRDSASTLSKQSQERSLAIDSQRIEMVALNTQSATLRDKVADLDERLGVAQSQSETLKEEAVGLRRSLAQAQTQVTLLQSRADELQSALGAKASDAESLTHRIAALEPRLAEQMRLSAETARERDVLVDELARARNLETDLRGHLEAAERRAEATIEQLQTEKSALETQLERVSADRTLLQREIATLRREAEESWEIERRETSLLRERINDVAVEVARLTSTLEGLESPIHALVAEDAAAPLAGINGADTGRANVPSLADRIRMLQARPTRANATS